MTDAGADFAVYGATVVGVAIGAACGGAPWWPFLLVLLAYYVNGTAFLAFSSIAERADRRIDDGRSLSFLGGLAEATETIAVHALWLVLPFWAAEIAAGHIVGVDRSADMLAVARARARREGWSNVTFVEADAAELDVDGLRARIGAATGRATAPLARLACALGGADIHARPWRFVARDAAPGSVREAAVRGGHIVAAVGRSPGEVAPTARS